MYADTSLIMDESQNIGDIVRNILEQANMWFTAIDLCMNNDNNVNVVFYVLLSKCTSSGCFL